MKAEQFLEEYNPSTIIDAITPFLTDQRKQRIDEVIARRLRSIQVAVEEPADAMNAIAVVRSCEVFGLMDMHLIGLPPHKHSGRGTKLGSDQWIRVHKYDRWETFAQRPSADDFLLAGAVVEGGIPLSEVPVDRPLCLVLGNERDGLSQKAQQQCDLLYTIPMRGMGDSFNISVAAGISLYDVTERKRQASEGDLSEQEKARLRALYYLRSAGLRKAKLYIEHYLVVGKLSFGK